MEGRSLRPVLVVGGRSAGKTAYARTLLDRARRAGLRVAGFYSEAEHEGRTKARYHLCDAADPTRRSLLASTRPIGPGDQRVGRFHLSAAAIAAANAGLVASLGADLVCIDEVGPLELEGGGFAPALRHLRERYRGILVLTARPSVVEPLTRLLQASAGGGGSWRGAAGPSSFLQL